MKVFGITVAVIFFMALYFVVAVFFTALAVGAANAWIIESTFSDGWDAAWNRWPITFLWALVFSVGAGAARRA